MLHQPSLKLPDREAPDVDVELVQFGLDTVAITGEMDLVLQLIRCYGQLAYRAWGAVASIAPLVVRPPGWELLILDYCSGFGAKDRLVRHLATPIDRTEGSSQMPGGGKPVASTKEARWKAATAYYLGRGFCPWTLVHHALNSN